MERPLRGGVCKTSVDDAEIKEKVEELLNHINSGENESHELIEILEASRQVVEGHKFVIKVALKIGDAERIIGDFEIWERLWLDNEDARIVKFNLENGKSFNFKLHSPKIE